MHRSLQERMPMVAIPLGIALIQLLACDPSPQKQSAATDVAAMKPPERIIAIAPNATEIITALGAVDRLVGVSDYCRLPADRASLPRIGGILNPNLERILQLQPDLVITRGRIREVEELCRANHISLYHDPTESFDDIFRTIGELGAILVRRDEAITLIDALRRRIDRVKKAVADQPRPRVLFTTDRPLESLSRLTTAGKDTFVDEIIRLAGGENVFGRVAVAYPEVNLESVLVAQPEVIIEVMPAARGEPDDLQRRVLEQWRKLGSLPATRTGRVYVFTDADMVIPSPRVADSIERLAGILHPGAHLE